MVTGPRPKYVDSDLFLSAQPKFAQDYSGNGDMPGQYRGVPLDGKGTKMESNWKEIVASADDMDENVVLTSHNKKDVFRVKK